jgi:hypothetical protein
MVVFALGSGHKGGRSIVKDLLLDPFFEPALMVPLPSGPEDVGIVVNSV